MENISLGESENPFERRRRLAAWWYQQTGSYPIARHVDALASFDVPIEKLIAEMERRWSFFRSAPRCLMAFNAVGEEMQSMEHKSDPPKGGSFTLGQLLGRYAR